MNNLDRFFAKLDREDEEGIATYIDHTTGKVKEYNGPRPFYELIEQRQKEQRETACNILEMRKVMRGKAKKDNWSTAALSMTPPTYEAPTTHPPIALQTITRRDYDTMLRVFFANIHPEHTPTQYVTETLDAVAERAYRPVQSDEGLIDCAREAMDILHEKSAALRSFAAVAAVCSDAKHYHKDLVLGQIALDSKLQEISAAYDRWSTQRR